MQAAPLLDWAHDVLAARGIDIVGDPDETRRRPWSLLIRLPTSAGCLWAKANARAFAHEGPLIATLARLQPGTVHAPIAVDSDRGWLLSSDGGETFTGTDEQWTDVVRRYVHLQQTSAAHLDELRATGTPFLPPDRLLDIYAHYEAAAPGLAAAIEHYAQILTATGRITVEHNDLHARNVFANGALFDWGDAALTHPFLSVRMHGGSWRRAFLDAWSNTTPVDPVEIDAARRLAPLIGLVPWITVDPTMELRAQAVTMLLDALRGALQPHPG
ncbi:hypothetical protein FOS14_04925 [Skermania sp. ID1734]|uniref:phosphotransferase n=1 Tax=Skermania sp. ID1734 TaxID=2597516 RepID=UPI00117E96AD|nr:phosphotransferase [Skermania sp. ID1734]TSE01093.1 hypothetical protein FOS14_04925 [Skermania sp. ID1734]